MLSTLLADSTSSGVKAGCVVSIAGAISSSCRPKETDPASASPARRPANKGVQPFLGTPVEGTFDWATAGVPKLNLFTVAGMLNTLWMSSDESTADVVGVVGVGLFTLRSRASLVVSV